MNAVLPENVFFQIAAQIARVNSMCFAIFVASTIVLGLIFWYRSPKTMTSEAEARSSSGSRLPLGSSGYPLIGETVEFIADGRTFFRTRRQKYGSVFRSHLCCWPTVVVTGAENVQKVLTASDSTLTYFSPMSFVRLLGRGALASSAGKRHSHLQRSIMRLLSPRVIAQLVAPIQRIVRDHVARWSGETPAVVSGSDCCQRMLLAVVSQCLFGFDLGTEELERITGLLGVFSDGLLSIPINLPGFAFHRAMQARIELGRFIAERTSSTACNNADEPSLLGLLHSADEGAVPRYGTVDLVLELIFGAKETTASAMCTALIEVSESLEVLAKLRRELVEYRVTPGTPVDYSVLASLDYLNDVVKEVLRIQPPVAGGFRRTQRPFQIQDYVIPSGWMILYCITDTHETSSSSLEDFARFDPDRWKRRGRECASEETHEEEESSSSTTRPGHESTTRQQQQQPNRTAQETRQDKDQSTATHVNDRFGYIPFGGGNRRFCVGKNLAKTIISIFLIELTNQMDRWQLPNGRPQIRTAPFPLPKDRLPVIFFPRKNSDSDMNT